MEIRTNDPPAPHPLPAGLIDLVDIVGHLERQGPGPGIRVGGREQDMAGSADPVLAIGHSNHGMERFPELLHRHQVRIPIDVRTVPYTRFVPRFNRDNLRRTRDGSQDPRGLAHPPEGGADCRVTAGPQAGIDLSRKERSIP